LYPANRSAANGSERLPLADESFEAGVVAQRFQVGIPLSTLYEIGAQWKRLHQQLEGVIEPILVDPPAGKVVERRPERAGRRGNLAHLGSRVLQHSMRAIPLIVFHHVRDDVKSRVRVAVAKQRLTCAG